MYALTDRSSADVRRAIDAAHPQHGPAAAALERVLRGAWPVIGRYRGLVVVNQRLPREQLHARLEPTLAPLRSLVERGQRSGELDPELPADWLIGTLIDLIHAASRQVTSGAMTADASERALLRTAAAATTAHRSTPQRGREGG
jgi:hypothetical protein